MDSKNAQRSLLSISVDLQFGLPRAFESELIQHIPHPHLQSSDDGHIQLAPLIEFLKILGYPLSRSSIWFYSAQSRTNIFAGRDPLPAGSMCMQEDLCNGTLSIVCREFVVMDSEASFESKE